MQGGKNVTGWLLLLLEPQSLPLHRAGEGSDVHVAEHCISRPLLLKRAWCAGHKQGIS